MNTRIVVTLRSEIKIFQLAVGAFLIAKIFWQLFLSLFHKLEIVQWYKKEDTEFYIGPDVPKFKVLAPNKYCKN